MSNCLSVYASCSKAVSDAEKSFVIYYTDKKGKKKTWCRRALSAEEAIEDFYFYVHAHVINANLEKKVTTMCVGY